MKYLQLYEVFNKNTYYEENAEISNKNGTYSFGNGRPFIAYLNWWEETHPPKKISQHFNASYVNLVNLKGIEKLPNLKILYCQGNKLTSLEGIENCTQLEELNCNNNYLTSLKGLENLKNLKVLYCKGNLLKNLDEIEDLPNLDKVYCIGNPWGGFEYPVSLKWFYLNNIAYTNRDWSYFRTYASQKAFLTKHPDRYNELKSQVGVRDDIKQEFPALARGDAWGFFDLKESLIKDKNLTLKPTPTLSIQDKYRDLFLHPYDSELIKWYDIEEILKYVSSSGIIYRIYITKNGKYVLTQKYYDGEEGIISIWDTTVFYKIIKELQSYKFQKEWLDVFPERAGDIEPFGFSPKIQKEYPAIIRGSKWGFFD